MNIFPRYCEVGLLALASCVLPPVTAAAQAAHPANNQVAKSAASPVPSAFAPLDRWRAAVVSGDRAALSAFYSTNPATKTKTPQGETTDTIEEPVFWASLHGAGLHRFDVKVLEIKNVQPDVKAMVLRIELVLKSTEGEKAGVVSVAQIWIRQGSEWRILSTQRGDIGAAVAMRLPEPHKPNIELYPDPHKAPEEIAGALRAASGDRKRVILVFGGNWCYDCHVLDATFRSRQFASIIAANYHVVHINVGSYDSNLDLAKKYEIPLEKGVPSLAILDSNGTLLVSQKKGEFESSSRIGPEDVLQFLDHWKR